MKLDNVGIYQVLTLPLEPVKEEDACWLPLFLGTVIARKYPTPQRLQERGVELPFDLMTALAGTMIFQRHEGGILLKGRSRLLYPVSGSTGESVQWHLVTSRSRQERLPDGPDGNKSWLKVTDRESLSNAPRTFLGYCREVIVDLGTNKTIEYYGNISSSGADDVDHRPFIQAPTSLTWGSSGMGIFGATLTHSIVWGQTLARTVNGDNVDYLGILDEAKSRPIILYDDHNKSQRGWMVPLLSVIFHMIHTWATDKNCLINPLPCVCITSPAGDDVRSILEKHWDFVVRSSSNEEMSKSRTIKDLVMQFWHGIEKRKEEDLFSARQSIPGVKLTTSRLYGWDYMNLVRGERSCQKQLKFSGNWMDLTENVRVLFGRGFGEIIKPAPGASVCAQWDPIPPKRMYLTATIDCLQKLSRMYGGDLCSQTSSRLTNKSYWNYSANSLFADCDVCHSATDPIKGKCAKVLQTLDSSARESTHASPLLPPPPEGAVVFGCQSKRNSLWKPVVTKIKLPMHLLQFLESGSRPTTHSPRNGFRRNQNVSENESGDSGSACLA
jgi:hypothetical protein